METLAWRTYDEIRGVMKGMAVIRVLGLSRGGAGVGRVGRVAAHDARVAAMSSVFFVVLDSIFHAKLFFFSFF